VRHIADEEGWNGRAYSHGRHGVASASERR
jgi:hypothetical protein